MILDEYLSRDADARALDIIDRHGGEVPRHLHDVPAETEPASRAYIVLNVLRPQVVKPHRRAPLALVRARAQQQAHQQVAVKEAEQRAPADARRQFEPLRLALLLAVERHHAHLREPRGVESAAQEMYIVARAAGPARLGVEAVRASRVVEAALQRLDKLADDHHRRITDVVVEIAQPQLHRLARPLRQHLEIRAAALKGGLQELEMEGREGRT